MQDPLLSAWATLAARTAEDADGFLSTAEIAAGLNISNRRAAHIVRRAHVEGRCEVGHKTIIRIDGVPTRVSAYKLLPAKGSKK